MTRSAQSKQAPINNRQKPPALKYRRNGSLLSKGKRSAMKPRMREWMEELLNQSACRGLVWKDRAKKIFEIGWYHASNQAFDPSEHADLFMRYAEFSGNKVKSIGDRGNRKGGYNSRLKSNFRSALQSLPDCIKLNDDKNSKGREHSVIYMFIDHTDPEYLRRKAAKNRNQRKHKLSARVKVEKVKYELPPIPVDTATATEQFEEGIEQKYSQQHEEDFVQFFDETSPILTDNNIILLDNIPTNLYELDTSLASETLDSTTNSTTSLPFSFFSTPSSSIMSTTPSIMATSSMTSSTLTGELSSCIVSSTDDFIDSSVGCGLSTNIMEMECEKFEGVDYWPQELISESESYTLELISPFPAQSEQESYIHPEMGSIVTAVKELPDQPPLPDFNALGVNDLFHEPMSHKNEKMTCGGSVYVKIETETEPVCKLEGLGFLEILQSS